jgi:hypothetical protein
MGRRRLDRDGVKLAYLEARQRGLSVRAAARAAGVHVATACRWRHADPAFDALVREVQVRPAADFGLRPTTRIEALVARLTALAGPGVFGRDKPSVACHPACPTCGSAVEVRKVGRSFGAPFWRCSGWPRCGWASWRPRHPTDCPACGGPRYWADSRRSVSCSQCGVRERVTVSTGIS